MILKMIDHYSNGNKAAFASKLDVTPQAISTWIKRDHFDIERIYAKCESISAEWLLTGNGSMLNSKDENECNSLYNDNESVETYKDILQKKEDVLANCYKEIGRRDAQIDMLKSELSKREQYHIAAEPGIYCGKRTPGSKKDPSVP